MDAVELHDVSSLQWSALLDGEERAWGGGEAERLQWAGKQRHVGVLDEAGTPLALAGAVRAEIAVGEERLDVVGIGSVIVTHTRRGEGLARLVIEAILELARELGPPTAMLFCREQLTALYARFGFRPIAGDVTAEQPTGRIVVPMRAMWAPLASQASWPEGRVAVLGEPF